MSILKAHNIISDPGISSNIFENLFGNMPFTQIQYNTPSDYVEKYWKQYSKSPYRNNSINGKIFEFIIATLFVRENILPLYLQAKVAFVPNVEYDAILYCPEFGPIVLSMKTSYRERYKQADLEAIALKYVHRKAKSFLLTLDKKDSDSVNKKIKEGEVIGLNESIYCLSPQFDNFIGRLKNLTFGIAKQVEIVESNLIVQ